MKKTRKQSLIKRLGTWALALAMVMSFSGITALADTSANTTDTGTITITNATIGETYTVYKLFDATYGESYVDTNGETVIPTTYVATEAQYKALSEKTGNVFAFAPITSSAYYDQETGDFAGYAKYQVTVGTYTEEDATTGEEVKKTYSDEDVIAFVKSLISSVGGFTGAEKINNQTANSDTVTFSDLDFGYYFVTSTLGAVVTVDTANPKVAVTDKNDGSPDMDNEPNPEEPIKDVQNSSGTSINGGTVNVNDTLTYVISWTNTGYYTEAVDGTQAYVEIKDAAPQGTSLVSATTAGNPTFKLLDSDGQEVTLTDDSAEITVGEKKYTFTAKAEVSGSDITWSFENVPKDYTVEVSFQVTVQEGAKDNDQNRIDNTADVVLDHNFDLKTNDVKNYVPDDSDPSKDVYKVTEETDGDGNTTQTVGTDSYNTQETNVGEILQYEITYKNTDTSAASVKIEDAAPSGTVYVKDSAALSVDGASVENANITIAADGTITWTYENLASGSTIKATFQVEVTAAAYGITDQTVRNTATVTVDNDPKITNEVNNPLKPDEDNPKDPNPGKVIIEDGIETQTNTGAYGDTVTFDIAVNAVNKVDEKAPEDYEGEDVVTIDNVTYMDRNKDGIADTEQVTEYYFYDKMDPGFTFGALTTLIINGEEYNVTKGTTDDTTGVTTWTATCKDSTTATFYTVTDSEGYTIINGIITWATPIYGTDNEGVQTTDIVGYTSLYPNCEVHLQYNASINTSATIAENGNLNKFKFSYNTASGTGDKDEPKSENPEYPQDLENGSDEKVTTTYTYAVAVQKYSEETGEPLEGAKFTVTDNYGNAIYAVPVKDADDNETGVYEYATSDDSEATNEFVTNGDGQIIIKGVDIGTYTFTETEAPAGYLLLKDSVDVDTTMTSSTTSWTDTETTRYFEAITEDEWDDFTGVAYVKNSETNNFEEKELPATYTTDETYYKVVAKEVEGTTESGSITYSFDTISTILEVANSSGSELPSTGGMGTKLLYALGILLALGAGITLVVRRRMRSGK